MSNHHTEKSTISQSFSGVFSVWKERGETLAVLLKRFRRGHDLNESVKLTYAGRLDPMAEGLVLILAGEERFHKDSLLGLPKVYEVDVVFGIETDTLDALGVIIGEGECIVEISRVQKAVEKMKQITTLPYPLYSSVPVKGKPLFSYARSGKEVSAPEKRSTIFEADIVAVETKSYSDVAREAVETIKKVAGDFRQEECCASWQYAATKKEHALATIATIRITASSGTYMRSLAQWLGKHCGTCAIAYRIKRIQIGEYT